MQNITITALVFIALYQLSSRVTIRPLTSACIIALVPLIYTLLIRIIFKASPQDILRWSDILMLLFQFVAAFLVFNKLDYDDTPATWIVWGVGGLIVISFIIPFFVFFLLSL
jgi:hypothetical protein